MTTTYTNAQTGCVQGLLSPTSIEPTAVLPDAVGKYDVLRLVRRLRKPVYFVLLNLILRVSGGNEAS